MTMTNTGAIADLLVPGLRAVMGQYKTYPDQWKEIFQTFTSDKNQEVEVEMKYPGMATIKPEGAPLSADSFGQRIRTNYVHRTVGTYLSITAEAIEDNLYPNQFPQQALSMRNSLRAAKNVLGANVVNNGFNAAYPIGDGQPLFSTAHPIDGGVYANTFQNSTDFSEAGVELGTIAVQKYRMQSGLLAATKPRKLIVAPELQFDASRLLNSQFRVETANSDISAIYHNDVIPQGYTVNQYINVPGLWMMITDADNGFKLYQRHDVKVGHDAGFLENSIMFKAYERYSFGNSNARSCFASGN